MSKILRAIAALALVTVGLVSFAGAASAQEYSGVAIEAPPTAEVLGLVTVTFVGFPGDTSIAFTLTRTATGSTTVDLGSTTVDLGSTTSAADGSGTLTFRMPAECGSYTLEATGGGVSRSTTITAPCATTGPATPVRAGALPYTGTESAPLVQMGIALLAVGALVTFVVRKRNASDA